MERLNRIFAEWAKDEKRTELASQKIELTVVGDITKAVKSMAAAEKSLDTVASQAKKAEAKHEKALLKAYNDSQNDQESLQDKLNKLRSIQAESKKAIDLANKAAKDLGLSAKEIPGFSQLESAISEYPSKFNAATDDVSKISKVTI
tara:strand:+ start:595 stop:1035 length:441 start_codon:yes stop_codon:yes gene_type:complete